MPNTSFVLSYKLEGEKLQFPAGWMSQDWQYRGAYQRVYFCGRDLDGDIRFLPTVRLRTDPKMDGLGRAVQ